MWILTSRNFSATSNNSAKAVVVRTVDYLGTSGILVVGNLGLGVLDKRSAEVLNEDCGSRGWIATLSLATGRYQSYHQGTQSLATARRF